jgi:asparagine synthase (glutamine-hydrolysing)
MSNEDDSLVMVFNGEIYNYRELAVELHNRGHLFRSRSDSEVLLHAYEEYGDRVVQYLDGMFAFVIYDRRARRLFGARDRFGKKPFYYTITDSGFYWASEFRALYYLVPDSVSEDYRAFYHYSTFNCFPKEYTFVKEIRKLLPGHTLRFEMHTHELESEQYYTVQPESAGVVDLGAPHQDRLRLLFRDAVQKRLMSDVPIGFFLSGGIDSSSMVLEAAKLHSPIHTFSIALASDNNDKDETPFAKLVADQCGAVHHEVHLTDDEFIESVPRVAWALDEPTVLVDAVLLDNLTRVARSEGVKVLMSGEGADEVFFGYPHYYEHVKKYLRDRWLYDLIPSGMKATSKHLLRAFAPDRLERVHRWLRERNRFLGGNVGLSDTEKHRLLSQRVLSGISIDEWSDSLLADGESDESKVLHLAKELTIREFRLRLPDLLLTRIDRITMANSVEARNPFLDTKLVEYAISLPFSELYDGTTGKIALRDAMKFTLPKPILARGKMGFGGSLEGRTNPSITKMHREVISGLTFLTDYYTPEYVESLFRRPSTNSYDQTYATWNMVMFGLWRQKLGELERKKHRFPSLDMVQI